MAKPAWPDPKYPGHPRIRKYRLVFQHGFVCFHGKLMKPEKHDRLQKPRNINNKQVDSTRQKTFTIAHFSDPHIASPTVHYKDIINKRVLGRLSWCIHRKKKHSQKVLKALLNDIRSLHPDHIAITGDLTHLGLPEEFSIAHKMLISLGNPSNITVVPGNHDIYTRTPWKDTFGLWTDYMLSEKNQNSTSSENRNQLSHLFPLLRVRGKIAIIGLSSAQTTWPFLATGRLGKTQLDKLEDLLADTQRRQMVRVILIHHPPLPGVTSWRRSLTDTKDFIAILRRYGAELILHGHTHRHLLKYIYMSQKKIPVLGASSASALDIRDDRRARYNVCHLTQNGCRWQMGLSVRLYSPETECFVKEKGMQILLPDPAWPDSKHPSHPRI